MAEAFDQLAASAKALEFAHYLAKGAEHLIEAVNARDELLQKIEEGEADADGALENANQAVVEFVRGLRTDIYEFRKRAARIAPAETQQSQAAAAPSAAPAARRGESLVVPDYVPADQCGEEKVTYWLYFGEECVGAKRLPVGTGAVDVRNAAASEAAVMCDRLNGETPANRRYKILHATVKVYNDRPGQERMRRDLPFERRALFPGELPFLDVGILSSLHSPEAGIHIRDVVVGLQRLAEDEGLELAVTLSEAVPGQARIRVDDANREAIGRFEASMAPYLVERGATLGAEFGVGYVRVDVPADNEPELEQERPRG